VRRSGLMAFASRLVTFVSETASRRLFALAAAIAAVALPALIALGVGVPEATSRQAALPVDHFACYPATFGASKARKVGLADQFGKTVALVRQPLRICSPTSKNGSGLINPRAHLVCYPIAFSTQFQARKVIVKNQFGSQPMTVLRPETLCVPSSKATSGAPGPIPTKLDHYTCYVVDPSGPFQSRIVKLADQFGSSRDTALKAVRLCAPTRKRGSTLIQPRVHLTCYQLKSATKAKRVATRNQFGVLKALPTLRQLLCAPSTKIVQP
jgi:hypothetical protein